MFEETITTLVGPDPSEPPRVISKRLSTTPHRLEPTLESRGGTDGPLYWVDLGSGVRSLSSLTLRQVPIRNGATDGEEPGVRETFGDGPGRGSSPLRPVHTQTQTNKSKGRTGGVRGVIRQEVH